MAHDEFVRATIHEFVERIWSTYDIDGYKQINNELKSFVENNNVKVEQLEEMIESGAGECLNMMVS